MVFKYFAVIILLLLCGCTATVDRRVDSGEVEVVDISVDRSETIQLPERDKHSGDSAVDKLLVDANRAIEEKQYAKAAAIIERAVRVAPQDGWAYYSLAQVHFYQNNVSLSQSLLSRARALADEDKELLTAIQTLSQRLLVGP